MDNMSIISTQLNKIFKKVYTAQDGQVAIDLYEKIINNGQKLDVIVSDIHLPEKNGIEILKYIRENNKKLPFIFTTAFSSSDYLLDSIKLHATAYLVKPINMLELVEKIYTSCYEQRTLLFKNKQAKELQNYIKAISHVASVLTINLDKTINSVNNYILKDSKYSQKELVSNSIEMLIHTDTPKDLLHEIWAKLKQGEIVQEKLKFLSKTQEISYYQSSFIPLFDDFGIEVSSYVFIGFLITEDELKKRTFSKNVRERLLSIQSENRVLKKEKELLINKLSTVEEFELNFANSSSKSKIASLNKQIEYFEKQLLSYDDKYNALLKKSASRLEELRIENKELKRKQEYYLSENKRIEKDRYEKELLLKTLEGGFQSKNEKIKALNREVEVRELKIIALQKELQRNNES